MRRFIVLLSLLAACRGPDRASGAAEFRGATLVHAVPKPDFTLEATNGRPFHFKSETHGAVTLLYFGYTNCTDVCPAHMANIAAVLHRLPPDQRRQVRVVFVTTDPARDTAAALRQWLSNFDTSFVGLRGPMPLVNRIQAVLGLPPAQVEPMPDSGHMAGAHGAAQAYGVGHAAQVLAFSPDDSLRVEYPFGVQQRDLEHDLPLLIANHSAER